MSEIEERLRQMVFDALPAPTPNGIIKCDATFGSIGMTGSYRVSEDSTETADFLAILPRDFQNEDNDFSSQVERLHEASCNNPDLPPWYRCNIEIAGDQCLFRYWREDPTITDLSQVERSIHGSLPTFPFRKQFPLGLLQQLETSDYELAFLEYFPRALSSRLPVPAIAFGYFALIDWQADTNNGSLDQYFARPTDCLGANIDRSRLYPEVRSTLQQLGLAEAVSLFEEAIALYAHFQARVDKSRDSMGIAAIPKQTESDIMERYYDMLDNIESRQWSYFGEHLAEFAVG